MLRKAALTGASLALASMLAFGFGASSASANKVDCTKVMAERGAGKKAKDIAKEMNISTSSVYRCKQKAAAKTTTAKTTTASVKPAPATTSATKSSK